MPPSASTATVCSQRCLPTGEQGIQLPCCPSHGSHGATGAPPPRRSADMQAFMPGTLPMPKASGHASPTCVIASSCTAAAV